jgi:UTP:GlnB (protein PII) uridylyltransferase
MVSPGALADDPLRLLRAARLAIELEFEIDPATADEIRRLAPRLIEAAPERRRDEFMRILASPGSAHGVRLMDSLGLLPVLIPEFDAARGCEQPGDFHYYDVFDHCIEALRVADWMLAAEEPQSPDLRPMRTALWDGLAFYPLREYLDEPTGGHSRLVLTKLATLLHDIAKPQTLSRDASGRIHFYGHSEQGAEIGRAVCTRLRLGNKETHFVKGLIEEHLRPPQLSQSGHPTDRAIFKFFRDLSDGAPACLLLSMADAASAHGPRIERSRWERHVAYIGYVLERGTSQAQTLGGRHFVSGDTLIRALELQPGPEVGRLLAALDEARATGAIATEDEAIRMARQLLETWRDERAGGRR